MRAEPIEVRRAMKRWGLERGVWAVRRGRDLGPSLVRMAARRGGA